MLVSSTRREVMYGVIPLVYCELFEVGAAVVNRLSHMLSKRSTGPDSQCLQKGLLSKKLS